MRRAIISIGTAEMAKYPFLPQARRHISQYEIDYEILVGMSEVRARAKKRVQASFDLAIALSSEHRQDDTVEIASFPLAILYVAGVDDPKLLERFALIEAKTINRYLKEEKHAEVIIEIAKAFKWDVGYEQGYEKSATIVPIFKYLENVARGRLSHDLKWKLVNRQLENGKVTITPYELARLLQEEVMNRIEDLADQEVTSLPQDIQKDIDELKAAFIKVKPQLDEFDQIIHAQESEYPPCISGFMKRAAKGQHLSHVERFALVTYLLHQGVSIDSVVTLFSNVSDFNEKKTRYQVENLAGVTGGRTEPYTTYNCESLQTHGVCNSPTDPICRTIRNPLMYHLRKQRQKQFLSEQNQKPEQNSQKPDQNKR
jgi:DNA primase large subunit